MSLAIKHGVRVHGLAPEMVLAAVIVDGVMRERNFAATITSAIDGHHSKGSLHYVGHALDFRTRDIAQGEHEIIRTIIQDRLGQDFDVVLEGDHLHIEMQPKQPYTA